MLLVFVDEGLELLNEVECQSLLATQSLGRVGVSVGAMPAIFPVNYGVVDGDIYFRTGEGLKQRAALDHTVVAFEVDQADPVGHEGWSVLVVGTAEEVPPSELPFDPAVVSDPWVAGERRHMVRVRAGFITGRRIHRPS